MHCSVLATTLCTSSCRDVLNRKLRDHGAWLRFSSSKEANTGTSTFTASSIIQFPSITESSLGSPSARSRAPQVFFQSGCRISLHSTHPSVSPYKPRNRIDVMVNSQACYRSTALACVTQFPIRPTVANFPAKPTDPTPHTQHPAFPYSPELFLPPSSMLFLIQICPIEHHSL